MNSQLRIIKQRFGIIGFDPMLDQAINIAVQVAPTDLSVLITGESGVGKEFFPKIIHEYSPYKHGHFIAVNCGAIPEGTIDSELFGHEKGSFTGAHEARKGYFEMADGGTIFLDEVADLPLSTQVRLLRVLESGEFFRVGASKAQKTRVRVVAATNVNVTDKIIKGRFREDLYYRLNAIPIHIPALSERKDDIFLLFTKFASDIAFKYSFPPIQLTDDAQDLLRNYSWPGNIRQLRNITDQISIVEKERLIDADKLRQYLEIRSGFNLPVPVSTETDHSHFSIFERELIYKLIADLSREVAELKNVIKETNVETHKITPKPRKYDFPEFTISENNETLFPEEPTDENPNTIEIEPHLLNEEQYSLIEAEKELIRKALEKNKMKRKLAAEELGISERTLYRKIKDYGFSIENKDKAGDNTEVSG